MHYLCMLVLQFKIFLEFWQIQRKIQISSNQEVTLTCNPYSASLQEGVENFLIPVYYCKRIGSHEMDRNPVQGVIAHLF